MKKKSTLSNWRAAIGVILTLVFFSSVLPAQPNVEIEGTVRNGTTGKPVKGQRLILLSPSQGMEEVSSVVSDSQGKFHFDKAAGPFFVVQTHYQGANYNQPVRPQERGLTVATVTVYDSTSSDANVAIARSQWRLVPDSGRLKIDEVFEIQNTTDPPRTLVRSDGDFKFAVPAGATVESASLEEAAGMPLPQTPREIVSGKLFAIDHPIQPGTTRIGVRLTADYSAQSFSFSQTLIHSIRQLFLFFPKDMQVTPPPGFQPASADTQNYQVYAASDKHPDDTIAMSVSGGSAPAADSGADGSDGGTQSDVTQLPNAIAAIQVPIAGLLGLVVLWSLGFAVFQRTGKTKSSNGLSPEVRKQVLAEKDYLVRRILELDRRFEAKEISERDYQLQRSRLKSKCAVLMLRLQPVSARKREKTLA